MIVRLKPCEGMRRARTYGSSNSKGLTASTLKGFGVCISQVLWRCLILLGFGASWSKLGKNVPLQNLNEQYNHMNVKGVIIVKTLNFFH